MTRSRRRSPASARPARGAGLAVPTMVAALLCGGSVFTIAAAGVLALDAQPVAAAGSVGGAAPLSPTAVPEASTGRVYSIAVVDPGDGGPDAPAAPDSAPMVSSGAPTVILLGIDPPPPGTPGPASAAGSASRVG
ncbi:MAG TPA: hypothetical protein VI248_24050 [Kineosporiaceae bacterium]